MVTRVGVTVLVVLVGWGSEEKVLALGSTHPSIAGRWGLGWPLAPTSVRKKNLHCAPNSKFVII